MAETDQLPALKPPMVTRFGFPPKKRMYLSVFPSWLNKLLDPSQGRDIIRDSLIAGHHRGSSAEESWKWSVVCFTSRQTQGSESVLNGDDNHGASIHEIVVGSVGETASASLQRAAVDPHVDRQIRRGGHILDVEGCDPRTKGVIMLRLRQSSMVLF